MKSTRLLPARWLILTILIAVWQFSVQAWAASPLDLDGYREVFEITGDEPLDLLGADATAGDFNGDGATDLATASCGAADKAGRTYVELGPLTRGESVAAGSADYTITGGEADTFACHISAGDVNGDGLSDHVIGAPLADQNDRGQSGSVYVVFGKSDPVDVDLSSFDQNLQGDAGFRIDGASGLSLAGEDVDFLGDLNGDGLGDVLAGSSLGGSTYVVFGQSHSLPIDLLAFHMDIQGSRGYRIAHRPPETNDLYTAVALGDINKDGLSEIGIGLIHKRAFPTRGRVYVVFGKGSNESQSVTDEGIGFRVVGRRGALTGSALSTVADMNGDSRAEVLVGEPETLRSRTTGGAYLIFGKRSTSSIRVSELGKRGFRIRGAPNGHAGESVSGLGDVDGDGVTDFAIGNPDASPRGRTGAGCVYVVYGKDSTGSVDLSHLGARGQRILGANGSTSMAAGDRLGAFLANPHSDRRDDVGDLLVGAPRAFGDRGASLLLWMP